MPLISAVRWRWCRCAFSFALCLLALWCSASTFAAPVLNRLAPEQQVVELADVISGRLDDRFVPFSSYHITPGDGAQWFRIDIESPLREQYDVLLLDMLYLQTLDVYFVPADRNMSASTFYQTGLAYPYASRPIDYSRYAFPVPQYEQPLRVYLRVTVNNSMLFHPQLMSALEFAHYASVRNSWSTFFIGAIGMVVFYALVIGMLSGRPRETLYFLGVMLGSLMVLLHFGGFLAQWLGDWPTLHRNLGRAFGTVTVAMHLLLFHHLFDFKRRFPRVGNLLLLLVSMLLLLTVVTLVVGPAALSSINRLATQASVLVILALSVWQVLRHVPYAKIYGLSILANTMGGLLFSLSVEGGIDSPWLAQHGLEIGLLFLSVFYAVLLAMRLRDERLHRDRLREETEIALAQSRAKSDFLAVMSHEIRTPMNGVLGMTELLRGTELNETQRHYTDAINASGKTLLSVIDDILDFSRVEAGHLHLDNVSFALDQVVAESILPYRFGANPGIDMQSSIAPDVPQQLLGDPLRLQQIIVNLLSNAFKFTASGEISLRVECIAQDDSVAHLKFIVRDSGPGIAAELLPRLFNPFQQAESSSSRKYGGSGLGLAICKRLVELMGGEISARNIGPFDAVRGACFEFTVRMVRDQTAVATKPALRSLQELTVLMVDDQPGYQQVFAEQAHYLGINLICVLDAMAVITIIRNGVKPDVIVIDKDMPHLDGLSLARNLRVLPELGDVPILLLTASSGLPSQATLQQAGIQLASVKPVSVEQLQSLLLDVLAPGTRARRAKTQDDDEINLTGMKVLVAEDNPVNRQVIRGLLTRLQVQFDIVEGGLAVVARAADAASHYDIVLMDCEMPDLDGYAATRRIREFESASGRARLPVVALTAHALAEFVDRCIAAGMDGHLAKPVDIVKLRAMLASHRANKLE